MLYPSGHQDQLDVAVRRSVLTGVSQTCGVIAVENAKAMDCDLMEITAYAGARPEHAEWQGQIVSLSGRKGYLSLADIGYGSGAGFKGWNCNHDWYPFFEGISTRMYADKELRELQNSDLYDKQQVQRKMERDIRATKRELAGYDAAMKNANPETAAAIRQDFEKKSVKLKQQETAMRSYCKSNGLLVDSSRTQAVYGKGTTQGFNRSTAQKAVWANKKALNSAGKSGIINKNERRVNTGGLRNEYPLSKKQKQECSEYAQRLGVPKEIIRFSDNMYTSYENLFGLTERLYIGTDVYPAVAGRGANSRISMRGSLAHEIVGHREACLSGLQYNAGSWQDEAQASIRAARFAPDLDFADRIVLLRDACIRARRNGAGVNELRKLRYVDRR